MGFKTPLRVEKIGENTWQLLSPLEGKVIGYFCRLEAMAIREGWDRYGVSITGVIKSIFA
ncbi:hypothetical protein [uncultured Desulfobacter sp.]|uniref:hypothetical protein n=1 Tax=uncultured Desulfobacter sp. TaxID=240139 RepID=UPI002AAAC080|nr:hypothetical protein [uncultured Desulfobacter sp.]